MRPKRSFLGFVAGDVDIGRRGTFQHQHGLTRHQHAAAPKTVDELGLVGVNPRDDLGRNHLRLDTVRHAQSQTAQDHIPCFQDSGLIERMHLEHPELALNDLRTRPGFGGLHSNIHHPENFISRRHLYIQCRHAFGWKIALRDRPDKRCILRLHLVQVTITA
jgi:hypothetical protein